MRKIEENKLENNKQGGIKESVLLKRNSRLLEIEKLIESKFNYKAKQFEHKGINTKRDIELEKMENSDFKEKLMEEKMDLARLENKEYNELIKEKIIIEFLNSELKGENLIQTPIHSDCEAAVVVPVYAEREHIFLLLDSLSKQEKINSQCFEAILVVNNADSEPTRDIKEDEEDYKRKLEVYIKAIGKDGENQQVIDIIKYINGENIEIDLSSNEKEIVDSLQNNNIKIHVVDKSSPGNSFPAKVANVGNARNRGVAEAVSRFYDQLHRNGLIIQTDSDTRLDPNYIESAITEFQKDPELIGAAGDLEFDEENQDKLLMSEIDHYRELEYFYNRLLEYLYNRERASDDDFKISFSGANMLSRAYESAVAGGVPKRFGGEDPEFGRRLGAIGKVKRIPALKATTLTRESPRTAVWAGHGQRFLKIKETLKKNGTLMVEGVDAVNNKFSLARQFESLVKKGKTKPDDLREVFTINNELQLSESELQLISDKIRAIGIFEDLRKDLEFIKVVSKFNEIRRSLHPKTPISEASEELLDEILKDQSINQRYQANIKEKIEFEDKWAQKRIKMLEIVLSKIDFNNIVDFSGEDLIKKFKDDQEKLGLADDDLEKLSNDSNLTNKLSACIIEAKYQRYDMEKIKSIFPNETLSMKDNPKKTILLKLRTLNQVIADTGKEKK